MMEPAVICPTMCSNPVQRNSRAQFAVENFPRVSMPSRNIAVSRGPQRSYPILGGSFTAWATSSVRISNELVISKIEDQFVAIANGLQQQAEVSVLLKAKRKGAATSRKHDTHSRADETLVKYPGRTAQEAWRFGLFLTWHKHLAAKEMQLYSSDCLNYCTKQL